MVQRRLDLYSRYERLWHWGQAAAIVLLMGTGAAIHNADWFGWIGFARLVAAHNALGLLLVANALLGLFYYVTTGAIRQYVPEPRDFMALAVRQAVYYLRGMFRGGEHPLEKSPQRRLNPLQQVTYLAILNVLLPLQMVTGLLMWSGQQWPAAVGSLGGLGGLALIHTLGAWMFAAFVVMHVYLTTTGRTPLANLKAMVVGYEEVVEPVSHPTRQPLAAGASHEHSA